MHERPARSRRWRRLAVSTIAAGVIAGAASGPAMADPGLLPGLSSTVGGVTDTAVGTVETTTGVVESTVPVVGDDVAQTVNQSVETTVTTLETVTGSGSGTPEPTAPPTASPIDAAQPSPTTAPATTPESTPAPETASSAPVMAEDGSAAGQPGRLSGRSPATPTTTTPTVLERVVRASEPRREAVTGQTVARTRVAAPVSPDGLADHSAATTSSIRDGHAVPQPLLHIDAGQSLLGGLLHESPSPMPIVVALLGLLALIAPRACGPRLRPATLAAHPADVRWRLVRPG